MNCEIPNCPYWCAESPLLEIGGRPHHHRCAVHRDMSTTMRRARLALGHSSLGSAGDAMNELDLQKWLKNNRQEMKRLLDCLSPRAREVVEDHDRRQTNLMRWQLAAAVSKRQLAEAVRGAPLAVASVTAAAAFCEDARDASQVGRSSRSMLGGKACCPPPLAPRAWGYVRP